MVINQDTGAVLREFSTIKESKGFKENPLYQRFEQVEKEFKELRAIESLSEEQLEHLDLLETEKDTLAEAIVSQSEVNQEDRDSIEKFHSLTEAVRTDFKVSASVFTHSWVRKDLEKPLGYLEDEKVYKKDSPKQH